MTAPAGDAPRPTARRNPMRTRAAADRGARRMWCRRAIPTPSTLRTRRPRLPPEIRLWPRRQCRRQQADGRVRQGGREARDRPVRDAGVRGGMQETKTFRPTIGVVTALGVFYGILILGAAYMFVSGAVRHPRGDILAASAGLAAFFLLNGLMIAYLLSCGAVVTATEIMKTSLFGRKSLAISNVRSAIITGGVRFALTPGVVRARGTQAHQLCCFRPFNRSAS